MGLRRAKRRKLILGIIGGILAAIIAFFAIVFCIGIAGYSIQDKKVESVEPVGSRYTPVMEDGVWTFKVDTSEEFKILQITDVHIGGGAFSVETDPKALSAVEKLIRTAKPDLVCVTGDMTFPVPPMSGSFNNLREAQLFAKLMDKLEVYYTICFGNHDSESYSFYTRDQIYDFYKTQKYCVCDRVENLDDINYAVNIKDKDSGKIVETIFMLDTHSYLTDGINILSNYDGLHTSQLDWYAAEVDRMTAINQAIDPTAGKVKSLMFMHIPFVEYETAWKEYRNNGNQDTDDVKYHYGKAEEKNEEACYSENDVKTFDKILEVGSTIGVFCGHDHLNYYSVTYKGVRLTYGMSIDYLAYPGIRRKVDQRGATEIYLNAEGEMRVEQLPLKSL